LYANITVGILVKIILGCGAEAGAPELGILPGAGAQIKNQESELSLKFRTGFLLDTNGFVK